MQGKGAGAVNRVELECQVLCAALRQSWVRRDKVGAFTSIRELSHLFPDLLPPPEERVSTNKANYYEVLGVRPQSGLNSIVVGYLRTVRKFLKEYNPKDHRQFYNTMLNAGFVLRKPRLRLSHDLVVARRWLYDSQAQDDEEVILDADGMPITPAGEVEQGQAVAQEAAQAQQASQAQEVSAAQNNSQPAAHEIAASAEQGTASDSLAAAEAAWKSNQAAQHQQAASAAPAAAEQQSPWQQPQSEIPYMDYSRFQKASESAQAAPPPAVPASEPAAPPPPTPPTPPAPHVQNLEPERGAPPPAVAPEPVIPEFKFDEAQLRKPEVEIDLPSIIRLMEASHLIGKLEVQAIKAQMVLAPNIPAEQLVINAGYATRTELASLKLAQDLLSAGKITMAQFQVAMYDERTSGLRMAESLQVRGWLETEVKNSIEELKQQ